MQKYMLPNVPRDCGGDSARAQICAMPVSPGAAEPCTLCAETYDNLACNLQHKVKKDAAYDDVCGATAKVHLTKNLAVHGRRVFS